VQRTGGKGWRLLNDERVAARPRSRTERAAHRDTFSGSARHDASAASAHDAHGTGDGNRGGRGVELDDSLSIFRPGDDPHEVLVQRERRYRGRVGGHQIAGLPAERDTLDRERTFVGDHVTPHARDAGGRHLSRERVHGGLALPEAQRERRIAAAPEIEIPFKHSVDHSAVTQHRCLKGMVRPKALERESGRHHFHDGRRLQKSIRVGREQRVAAGDRHHDHAPRATAGARSEHQRKVGRQC